MRIYQRRRVAATRIYQRRRVAATRIYQGRRVAATRIYQRRRVAGWEEEHESRRYASALDAMASMAKRGRASATGTPTASKRRQSHIGRRISMMVQAVETAPVFEAAAKTGFNARLAVASGVTGVWTFSFAMGQAFDPRVCSARGACWDLRLNTVTMAGYTCIELGFVLAAARHATTVRARLLESGAATSERTKAQLDRLYNRLVALAGAMVCIGCWALYRTPSGDPQVRRSSRSRNIPRGARGGGRDPASDDPAGNP